MLIEKLNKERIPESHNKIKKSGTTFGYNLALWLDIQVLCCVGSVVFIHFAF
jgi:hypothetical protein